jgi:AraC family transcriptional regulator
MGGSSGHPCKEHTGVVDSRVVSDIALSVIWLPPRLELPKHRHADGCLGLFLKGEAMEAFGSATYHCTPGTVLVRPAEEPHADHLAEAGALIFVIEPSPAWVEDVREHGVFLDRPELLGRDRVSALAGQLYHESRRLDAASPLCVQALMFEIGACLIRRGEAASAHDPAWLNRVRSRIDDTYREKLCLSDLAREAGVHSVHLARTFRENYGCTVGQYLRRRRIEAAARALRDSDDSLVDIALDAGFTSQSQFCTAFRRLMDCTPSQYRRAIG